RRRPRSPTRSAARTDGKRANGFPPRSARSSVRRTSSACLCAPVRLCLPQSPCSSPCLESLPESLLFRQYGVRARGFAHAGTLDFFFRPSPIGAGIAAHETASFCVSIRRLGNQRLSL